jgi:DNA-binding CsgD family transcriptional regulator
VAVVSTIRARRCAWRARLSVVAGLVVAGTWSTLEQAHGAGVRLDAILLDVGVGAPSAERPGEAALSPREAQVMALLAHGCRDKELPARLHVTAHTARTYLRRAMVKLGATSRAEAVATWSRLRPHGLPGGAGS